MKLIPSAAVLFAIGLLSSAAQAADFSDTAISYRYGTKFEEPFNGKDISKNILGLTHISGYKYGTNFFNVDFLMSDKNDPGTSKQTSGAQEVYLVYRHTLDIGKLRGSDIKFGPFRGLGATLGFDLNTKNDGYDSRKRMLVAGPTLMWDVPGVFNTSILIFKESNAPSIVTSRYSYKTHAALDASWSIPIGALPLAFEGYADFIASKGKNEVGFDTAAETHVDMQLMWDVGTSTGLAPKNTLKVGLEYEYWKNKFGNKSSVPGSLAKTPMIRAEYHF